MRSFLCNELEPLAYLIYLIAVLLYYLQFKFVRHQVLAIYYAIAALVLYAGIAITSIDNNWTYNVVFLVNICVFSWYFWQLLYSRRKKNIILICLLVNICIFIYSDIIRLNFNTYFNSLAYGTTFMCIIVYTLLYLHQVLADVKEENLLMNFDFWLICGYLMYYLGSFVVVIYYQNAAVGKRANIWAIQNILLFICSVVMLVISRRIIKKQKII